MKVLFLKKNLMAEVQDLSKDYMEKHISINVSPLEDAKDLEQALNASLHGDILMRKGFFPSTHGMSFVTRRIDCDMDKIFTTFRNGYEQEWIQGSEMDVAMVAYALTAKVWSDLGPLAGLALEIKQNVVVQHPKICCQICVLGWMEPCYLKEK